MAALASASSDTQPCPVDIDLTSPNHPTAPDVEVTSIGNSADNIIELNLDAMEIDMAAIRSPRRRAQALPPRVVISISGESTLQECSIERAGSSGKSFDMSDPPTGTTYTGRCVGKQLFISDVYEKKKVEALVKITAPATDDKPERVIDTFLSRPIKVINWPSRKRQSVKNLESMDRRFRCSVGNVDAAWFRERLGCVVRHAVAGRYRRDQREDGCWARTLWECSPFPQNPSQAPPARPRGRGTETPRAGRAIGAVQAQPARVEDVHRVQGELLQDRSGEGVLHRAPVAVKYPFDTGRGPTSSVATGSKIQHKEIEQFLATAFEDGFDKSELSTSPASTGTAPLRHLAQRRRPSLPVTRQPVQARPGCPEHTDREEHPVDEEMLWSLHAHPLLNLRLPRVSPPQRCSIISDWVLGHRSGFDLVRTDKMVWIQIHGHLKEGSGPMSAWIYFSRLYTMVSGPAEFFFWRFPKMAKTGQRATAENRWFGLVPATPMYPKLTK
ncbi:hypothetical protein DFH08DRAFT_814388 [Mycena albidolilacea]|uniref:RBP-J/Cbf11/Cbf12 DNA binding domain-containing protein n=1 Tax=Mycena albidolilacea TaxID=1033008 RepID=A0AAD6ZPQ8_9AGAR|nr:hypothetical protein DFH08DRAFT_814388 [Mycena albidolilacea]